MKLCLEDMASVCLLAPIKEETTEAWQLTDICQVYMIVVLQVRKLAVDHDKRVADLLELVQLSGLGDR